VAVAGAPGQPAAGGRPGRWGLGVRGGGAAGRTLAAEGPTTLDVEDPDSREQAAEASIKASMELLEPAERELLAQLGIFAEDIDIPRDVLVTWWHHGMGLSPAHVDRFCERLDGLCLVANYDRADRSLRLHDVIRSYLRGRLGERLPAAHRSLAEAARPLVRTRRPAHPVVAAARRRRLPLAQPLPAPARRRPGRGTEPDRLRPAVGRGGRTPAQADRGPGRLGAAPTRPRRPCTGRCNSTPTCSPRSSPPMPCKTCWSTASPGTRTYARSPSGTRRYSPAIRLTSQRQLPDQPHPALRHTLTGHTGPVGRARSPWTAASYSPPARTRTARIWAASSAAPGALCGGAASPGVSAQPNGRLMTLTTSYLRRVRRSGRGNRALGVRRDRPARAPSGRTSRRANRDRRAGLRVPAPAQARQSDLQLRGRRVPLPPPPGPADLTPTHEPQLHCAAVILVR
jgi:hypothetical protein